MTPETPPQGPFLLKSTYTETRLITESEPEVCCPLCLDLLKMGF